MRGALLVWSIMLPGGLKTNTPQNYPGDKVTNLMELTDDGALKTTTKKGNGVNIRMMKVITILSSLNLTLNYEKNIFLGKFPAASL